MFPLRSWVWSSASWRFDVTEDLNPDRELSSLQTERKTFASVLFAFLLWNKTWPRTYLEELPSELWKLRFMIGNLVWERNHSALCPVGWGPLFPDVLMLIPKARLTGELHWLGEAPESYRGDADHVRPWAPPVTALWVMFSLHLLHASDCLSKTNSNVGSGKKQTTKKPHYHIWNVMRSQDHPSWRKAWIHVEALCKLQNDILDKSHRKTWNGGRNRLCHYQVAETFK